MTINVFLERYQINGGQVALDTPINYFPNSSEIFSAQGHGNNVDNLTTSINAGTWISQNDCDNCAYVNIRIDNVLPTHNYISLKYIGTAANGDEIPGEAFIYPNGSSFNEGDYIIFDSAEGYDGDNPYNFFLPDTPDTSIVISEIFHKHSQNTGGYIFTQSPPFIKLFNNTNDDIDLKNKWLRICRNNLLTPSQISNYESGDCPPEHELLVQFDTLNDVLNECITHCKNGNDNFRFYGQNTFIKSKDYFTILGNSCDSANCMTGATYLDAVGASTVVDYMSPSGDQNLGGKFVEYVQGNIYGVGKVIDPCNYCRGDGNDISVASAALNFDIFTNTIALYNDNFGTPGELIVHTVVNQNNQLFQNDHPGLSGQGFGVNQDAIPFTGDAGKSYEFTKEYYDGSTDGEEEATELSLTPSNWRLNYQNRPMDLGYLFPERECDDENNPLVCYPSLGEWAYCYQLGVCPGSQVLDNKWDGSVNPSEMNMTFEGGMPPTIYGNFGSPNRQNYYSCDGEGYTDDSGFCPGDLEYDCSGVPGGDNVYFDCNGERCGDAALDNCGICDGDNSSCTGCTDSNALNYNKIYSGGNFYSDDCLYYDGDTPYESCTDSWDTEDWRDGHCDYLIFFEFGSTNQNTFEVKMFNAYDVHQIQHIQFNGVTFNSAELSDGNSMFELIGCVGGPNGSCDDISPNTNYDTIKIISTNNNSEEGIISSSSGDYPNTEFTITFGYDYNSITSNQDSSISISSVGEVIYKLPDGWDNVSATIDSPTDTISSDCAGKLFNQDGEDPLTIVDNCGHCGGACTDSHFGSATGVLYDYITDNSNHTNPCYNWNTNGCVDCSGTKNGDADYDSCGVCDGSVDYEFSLYTGGVNNNSANNNVYICSHYNWGCGNETFCGVGEPGRRTVSCGDCSGSTPNCINHNCCCDSDGDGVCGDDADPDGNGIDLCNVCGGTNFYELTCNTAIDFNYTDQSYTRGASCGNYNLACGGTINCGSCEGETPDCGDSDSGDELRGQCWCEPDGSVDGAPNGSQIDGTDLCEKCNGTNRTCCNNHGDAVCSDNTRNNNYSDCIDAGNDYICECDDRWCGSDCSDSSDLACVGYTCGNEQVCGNSCGTCDTDAAPDCDGNPGNCYCDGVVGCDGVCRSGHVEDCAGNCSNLDSYLPTVDATLYSYNSSGDFNGDGTLGYDCAGQCGGTNFVNGCSYCEGPQGDGLPTTYTGYITTDGSVVADYTYEYNRDCAGVCNGTAYKDSCNICSTETNSHYYKDCNGYCPNNGNYDGSVDPCMTDDGNNIPQWCGTGSVGGRDVCGECNGPGLQTYYHDEDGDGRGDPNDTENYCPSDCNPCAGTPKPSGWVNNNLDGNPDYYCLDDVIDNCGVCGGNNTLYVSYASDYSGHPSWYTDNNISTSCFDSNNSSCKGCIDASWVCDDADLSPAGFFSNENSCNSACDNTCTQSPDYDNCYIIGGGANSCGYPTMCGEEGAENYSSGCNNHQRRNCTGNCYYQPTIESPSFPLNSSITEDGTFTQSLTILDRTTGFSNYNLYENNNSSAQEAIWFTLTSGGGYINTDVSSALSGTGNTRTLTLNTLANEFGTGASGTLSIKNQYGTKQYTVNLDVTSQDDPLTFSIKTHPSTFSANSTTTMVVQADDADGISSSATVTLDNSSPDLPTGVTVDISSVTLSRNNTHGEWTITFTSDCTTGINATSGYKINYNPANVTTNSFTITTTNSTLTGITTSINNTNGYGDNYLLDPDGNNKSFSLTCSTDADPEGCPLNYSWSVATGQDSGYTISNSNSQNTSVEITNFGTWKFRCIVSDGVNLIDGETDSIELLNKVGCQSNISYTYSNPFSGTDQIFLNDNYDRQANITGTCTYTDCNSNTGFQTGDFPTLSGDTITCPGDGNGSCPYVNDACGNCGNPNNSILPTNGTSFTGTFTQRLLTCSDYYNGAECGTYNNGCDSNLICSSGLYSDGNGGCNQPQPECTDGVCSCANGYDTGCNCGIFYGCDNSTCDGDLASCSGFECGESCPYDYVDEGSIDSSTDCGSCLSDDEPDCVNHTCTCWTGGSLGGELDCSGMCNGDAYTDDCGRCVCESGDNCISTGYTTAGIKDLCGVCNGNNTTCCNGNGTAFCSIDGGFTSNGDTGITSCDGSDGDVYCNCNSGKCSVSGQHDTLNNYFNSESTTATNEDACNLDVDGCGTCAGGTSPSCTGHNCGGNGCHPSASNHNDCGTCSGNTPDCSVDQNGQSGGTCECPVDLDGCNFCPTNLPYNGNACYTNNCPDWSLAAAAGCVVDCQENPGISNNYTYDDCGICNGGNVTLGCDGYCYNDYPSEYFDCNGDYQQIPCIDDCGTCQYVNGETQFTNDVDYGCYNGNCPNFHCSDCNQVVNNGNPGPNIVDDCGVCHDPDCDNSSENLPDCSGSPGDSWTDVCGNGLIPGNSDWNGCVTCDNCIDGDVLDICDVCGGTNSNCATFDLKNLQPTTGTGCSDGECWSVELWMSNIPTDITEIEIPFENAVRNDFSTGTDVSSYINIPQIHSATLSSKMSAYGFDFGFIDGEPSNPGKWENYEYGKKIFLSGGTIDESNSSFKVADVKFKIQQNKPYLLIDFRKTGENPTEWVKITRSNGVIYAKSDGNSAANLGDYIFEIFGCTNHYSGIASNPIDGQTDGQCYSSDCTNFNCDDTLPNNSSYCTTKTCNGWTHTCNPNGDNCCCVYPTFEISEFIFDTTSYSSASLSDGNTSFNITKNNTYIPNDKFNFLTTTGSAFNSGFDDYEFITKKFKKSLRKSPYTLSDTLYSEIENFDITDTISDGNTNILTTALLTNKSELPSGDYKLMLSWPIESYDGDIDYDFEEAILKKEIPFKITRSACSVDNGNYNNGNMNSCISSFGIGNNNPYADIDDGSCQFHDIYSNTWYCTLDDSVGPDYIDGNKWKYYYTQASCEGVCGLGQCTQIQDRCCIDTDLDFTCGTDQGVCTGGNDLIRHVWYYDSDNDGIGCSEDKLTTCATIDYPYGDPSPHTQYLYDGPTDNLDGIGDMIYDLYGGAYSEFDHALNNGERAYLKGLESDFGSCDCSAQYHCKTDIDNISTPFYTESDCESNTSCGSGECEHIPYIKDSCDLCQPLLDGYTQNNLLSQEASDIPWHYDHHSQQEDEPNTDGVTHPFGLEVKKIKEGDYFAASAMRGGPVFKVSQTEEEDVFGYQEVNTTPIPVLRAGEQYTFSYYLMIPDDMIEHKDGNGTIRNPYTNTASINLIRTPREWYNGNCELRDRRFVDYWTAYDDCPSKQLVTSGTEWNSYMRIDHTTSEHQGQDFLNIPLNSNKNQWQRFILTFTLPDDMSSVDSRVSCLNENGIWDDVTGCSITPSNAVEEWISISHKLGNMGAYNGICYNAPTGTCSISGNDCERNLDCPGNETCSNVEKGDRNNWNHFDHRSECFCRNPENYDEYNGTYTPTDESVFEEMSIGDIRIRTYSAAGSCARDDWGDGIPNSEHRYESYRSMDTHRMYVAGAQLELGDTATPLNEYTALGEYDSRNDCGFCNVDYNNGGSIVVYLEDNSTTIINYNNQTDCAGICWNPNEQDTSCSRVLSDIACPNGNECDGLDNHWCDVSEGFCRYNNCDLGFGSFDDDCGICSNYYINGESNHLYNDNKDECGICHNTKYVCSEDCFGSGHGPTIDSNRIWVSDSTCSNQCSGNCIMMNNNCNDSPSSPADISWKYEQPYDYDITDNWNNSHPWTWNWNMSCTYCDNLIYPSGGGPQYPDSCGFCCGTESAETVGGFETCHTGNEGDFSIVGPLAGCNGICNEQGNLPTFDDVGLCCLYDQMVNRFPDIDVYNTTNETEIYGQRVGEIGFCSDPNSANSSPSICMCGVEIDNFDGSCTSGSSTGNTWYYTNSLKICSDYLSEGTEVLESELLINWADGSIHNCATNGNGEINPVGTNGCTAWETQPDRLSGQSYDYIVETDLCEGYVDDCGICWSKDEYDESGGEILNSLKDCAGNCPPFNTHRVDDCGACLNPTCVENAPIPFTWTASDTPLTYQACEEGSWPTNILWNSSCTGCTDSNGENNASCTNPITGATELCTLSCNNDTYQLDFWSNPGDNADVSNWTVDSHANENFCDGGDSDETGNFINCCCDFSIGNLTPTILDMNGDGSIDTDDKRNGNYVHGIIKEGSIDDTLIKGVYLTWNYNGFLGVCSDTSDYPRITCDIDDNCVDTSPTGGECISVINFEIFKDVQENPQNGNGDDDWGSVMGSSQEGKTLWVSPNTFGYLDELTSPINHLIQSDIDINTYFPYYVQSIGGNYIKFSNYLGFPGVSSPEDYESESYPWVESDAVQVDVIKSAISVSSPPINTSYTARDGYNGNEGINLQVDYTGFMIDNNFDDFIYSSLHVFLFDFDDDYIDDWLVENISTTNGQLGFNLTRPGFYNDSIWNKIQRSGEYKFYFEYPVGSGEFLPIPQNNNENYFSLIFNVVSGCMDGPGVEELVPITTGDVGACTCETCYGYLCDDCSLYDIESTPSSCHSFGFYNPNANIDTCSLDGTTLCNNNDDCNGDNNLCNNSCVYPIPGCLDDGFAQGGSCLTGYDSCESHSDCQSINPDYPICGYDNLCHKECYQPGSTDQCSDDGGICEQAPGTYINSLFGFGSILPETPANNYYYCSHSKDTGDYLTPDTCDGIGESYNNDCVNSCYSSWGYCEGDEASCSLNLTKEDCSGECTWVIQNPDLNADLCESSECGAYSTYEPDESVCKYDGCLEEDAVNYVGNYYDDIDSFEQCQPYTKCCVWEIEYRLQYSIRMNDANGERLMIPGGNNDGDYEGYISWGFYEDNLNLQLPILDSLIPMGIEDNEIWIKFKLIGRTPTGIGNKYDVDDPYGVFMPEAGEDPEGYSWFLISDSMIATEHLGEQSWSIPSEFQNIETEFGHGICTSNDVETAGNPCDEDSDCGEGVCKFTEYSVKLPGYDPFDRVYLDKNFEIQTKLTHPCVITNSCSLLPNVDITTNLQVTKTFTLRFTENNYAPVFDIVQEFPDVYLDVADAESFEYVYEFEAYDFDNHPFDISTTSDSDYGLLISPQITTNIFNQNTEQLYNVTFTSEENSVGYHNITAVLSQPQSDTIIRSYGCSHEESQGYPTTCLGDEAGDGTAFCNSLYAGSTCITVDKPLYPETQIIKQFQVHIVDSSGPDGGAVIVAQNVTNRYQQNYKITISGNDNRDTIGGGETYETVPTGLYDYEISYSYANLEPISPKLCQISNGALIDIPCQTINDCPDSFCTDLVTPNENDCCQNGACEPVATDTSCEEDGDCENFGLGYYCSDTNFCYQYAEKQWIEVTSCDDNPIYTGNTCPALTNTEKVYVYGESPTGWLSQPESWWNETDNLNEPGLDAWPTNFISAWEDLVSQEKLYYEDGTLVTNLLPSGLIQIENDFSGNLLYGINCFDFISLNIEMLTTESLINTLPEYNNPNIGGWVPKNAYHEELNPTGDLQDTIWKYRVDVREFYSKQSMDGFPKTYQDWTDSIQNYPLLPIGVDNNYYPPPNYFYQGSEVSNLIENGIIVNFLDGGRYEIEVNAFDLHWPTTNSGSWVSSPIDVVSAPIRQTISTQYQPYQGLNIPRNVLPTIKNTESDIMNPDNNIDDRQTLGIFYFDEDNDSEVSWEELVQDTDLPDSMKQLSDITHSSFHNQDNWDFCGSRNIREHMLNQRIIFDSMKIRDDNNSVTIMNQWPNIDDVYSVECPPITSNYHNVSSRIPCLGENAYNSMNGGQTLENFWLGEGAPSQLSLSSFVDGTGTFKEDVYLVGWIYVTDTEYVSRIIEMTNGQNNIDGFEIDLSYLYDNNDWIIGHNWIEVPLNGNTYYRNPQGGNRTDINYDGISRIELYKTGCEGGVSYNFTPDADIKTPLSLNGTYATPFNYYDYKLQKQEHDDLKASTEISIWFYKRGNSFQCYQDGELTPCVPGDDDNICDTGVCSEWPFSKRPIQEYGSDQDTFVTLVDWGDGSDIESSPLECGNGKFIKHLYDKPGIYEISGYMFTTDVTSDGAPNGVLSFKKFRMWININKDYKGEYEFEQLGGEGSTFIPYETFENYKNSTPIIGGLSEYSIYKKSIARNLGYISESIYVDLPFDNIQDKLDSENALANIDETFIGNALMAWTGSYIPDNVKTLFTPYGEIIPDIEILKSQKTKGFYSGSVNSDGEIIGNSATLIYNGIYNNLGELGQSIGDVDLNQFRYFKTGSIPIWELLGFDTTIDSTILYQISDFSIANNDDNDQGDHHYIYLGELVAGQSYNISFDINGNESGYFSIKTGAYLNVPQEDIFTGITNQSVEILDYIAPYTDEIFLQSGGSTQFEGTISNFVISINEHVGNPASPRYWKNIIPQSHNVIEDREGYEDGTIDINSNQEWLGTNEYGNRYYYPVLPKINNLGKFDIKLGLQKNNLPYSSRESGSWDENNIIPATDKYYQNVNLDIDFDFSTTEENSLRDTQSGKEGFGIFIGDYKINYDEVNKPSKNDTITSLNISKEIERGAY